MFVSNVRNILIIVITFIVCVAKRCIKKCQVFSKTKYFNGLVFLYSGDKGKGKTNLMMRIFHFYKINLCMYHCT